MQTLSSILAESAKRHKHLCPRQVLGARMGLYAGEILGLDLPRADKRLLVIAETDGCAVDGLIAATNCRVGSRTLRILDFGKVAATFVDTYTEASIRIAPSQRSRSLALTYATRACNHWEAMLSAYQIIPMQEMFTVQAVQLTVSLSEIISKPGKKAICEICREEIINGREISNGGKVLCRACSGDGYYHLSALSQPLQKEIVPVP